MILRAALQEYGRE